MFDSGRRPLAPTEPTTEELVEARERTDAGLRLAFPHLVDRTAPEPPTVPPALNAESAKRVSSKLLDAQQSIREAIQEVPLEGEQELHGWCSALLSGIDHAGAKIAERFGS